MNKEAKNRSQSGESWLLRTLADDKRSRIAIPLIAILMSLVVASIILLIMGKNPVTAFLGFLRGCGLWLKPSYAGGQSLLSDFTSFLGILTPMMLASLGVIVAMRAGLFNIGVAGQMLMSGFVASVFIGYSPLPAVIAKPLVIVVGIVVGGALGALTGFLKHRFNIHEVVTSIMMNYIISYVTGFFINTYYVDIVTRQSRPVGAAARLTIADIPVGDGKVGLPLGIILAALAVFLVKFILDRTTTGFRLKAVGQNPYCAQYAGINVGGNTVLAMLLSGVLAGLAGITYYLGYFATIVPKDLAGLGYDAIAVSVLGNVSPVGSIFASILITIFQKGSVYMSSTVGVPKEISSVIIGVLLLFSACGGYIHYVAKRKRMVTPVKTAKSAKEGK